MKIAKSYTILILCFVLLTGIFNSLSAQYAPPAGQSGTTAIHADSSIFVDWADDCIVERGWADISTPEYGLTTSGVDTNGIYKADNVVVSLGDGGVAKLTFDIPISDGPGWDFAVFENSFLDDFLELAFVEVSSNGIDFYRFNSTSLTQQDTQVATFGLIDATQINNLAGKYSAMYGVPCDLSELIDFAELDLSSIISVRIIDVVGSINSDYATYDSEGRIINDPWPTPFESGGFDLDAVGVIHNRNNTSVNEIVKNAGSIISPNPANSYFTISINENISKVMIMDISGKTVLDYSNPQNNFVDIQPLLRGLYIVKIFGEASLYTVKLIKR